MNEFREHRVRCLSSAGFHQIAYVEWGAADNPRVLFCVHGLTRCGRDFDVLAKRLSSEYRVVCPDVAGRGQSDWLRDKHLYNVPQYCADMAAVLAHVDGQASIETLHWLGTSMGGLIGMAMAGQLETPISKLVLNDVGPVVTAVSIQRIGEYVGKAPRFETIDQAQAYIQLVAASFGQHSPEQWRKLTVDVTRQAEDGKIEFRYDPGIAVTFQSAALESAGKDIELWPFYEAIRCPTLLVRGAESDLLLPQTAAAMTTRGPCAKLVEFAGVGHAPTLLSAEQIEPIRHFLLST